ncbi:unnamed protein product [Polarella glacialis]|uniref:Uncharacterized protein n=1 Tax=Polarella glacialis TaxID=89957 RepID=A0A813F5B1_POLGL|nr:unnamed protein product [Polarella glacialis]
MFYYMIFGSSVNPAGNDGPSGGSHIKGTLIYISLGGWLLHSETEGDLNLLVNTQAATVMHELGHALGLRHGGGDNIINKPNYISIMNYLYQTSGLPKLGHPQEGDRFYLAHPACNTHLCSGSCTWDQKVAALHDGPRSKSFRIGYSHGQSMHIDESAVSEQGGLADKPGEGTTPVDFNCDGNISSAPIRKLVHDCIDDPLSRFDPGKPDRNEACAGKNGTRRQRAVLNDHDDWGQLSLFFAELYDPSALDLRLGAYLERLRREGSSLGITF